MGFGDFFNSLFGGLGSLLQEIEKFLVALLDALQRVLSFIWQGVLSVFKWAHDSFHGVVAFLKHLWENHIKGIIQDIQGWLTTVHRWLEAHLAPILKWLHKVQAYLDRWYRLYLKPYLELLQKIRGYLRILRLFHIKWAEKLDRRLGQYEAELAHNFLLIKGTLNDIINMVNGFADPFRLGRMVLVSIAGRRMAASVVRAITGLPLGFFWPRTGKGTFAWEEPVRSSADLADPVRNPPVSDLLAGLISPLPTFFDSTDPTPSDADLDSLETVPFFDDLGQSLLDGELWFDSIPDVPASILEALNTGRGLIGDATAPVPKQVV